LLSKNSRVYWDFNSQSGNPLGNVWVHFLAFSHTPGSINCDSWASFSACTFASPYFGHEPKVKGGCDIDAKIIKSIKIIYVYELFRLPHDPGTKPS
jgi:hypothetical protein